MATSRTRKRLIGILAEASSFGLLCAVIGLLWGWISRKNLGRDDYTFLLPTFFVAGSVIYAAGESIAGGRIAGALLGSILGLLVVGGLTKGIAPDPDHVFVRLVAPGAGFILGALLGAAAQRAIRQQPPSNSLSVEVEDETEKKKEPLDSGN